MRTSSIFVWAASALVALADTCPDGSGASTVNGQTACCPGILQNNGDGAACVLGCKLDSPSCFPFCSDGTGLTTSGTCTATVPLSASNYLSSVYGSNAGASTAAGNTVATTAAGSSASGAAAATGGSGSTPASSPSATGAATGATTGATTGSMTTSATASAKSATSSTSKGGAAGQTHAPIMALAGVAMAGLAIL